MNWIFSIIVIIVIGLIFSRHEIRKTLILRRIMNQKNEMSSAEFKKIVNNHFAPRIKELGFEGKNWEYSKQTQNGLDFKIAFGPSRYGGGFCIDLIINSGYKIKYNDLEHTIYHFWSRLTPKKKMADYWWRYKGNEQDNILLLDNILKLINTRGQEWLNNFSDYPNDLKNITLKDIENIEKLRKRYLTDNQTKLFWAIDLVMFHDKEKKFDKVIEFANFGLKEIKTGYGSDWTQYLEEKINYAQQRL